MRGYPTRTPERVRLAQQMRDNGFTLRECAEHFGVGVQTVHDWTTDPDGSKLRARHESYRGECEVCGGPTCGSYGIDKAPTVCLDCLRWTPEAMKAWVLDYFEEHGYPPRQRVSPWRSSGGSLTAHFGTWNNLLLACGLPLACDRRPETQQAIERRIAAGESVASIAHDLGMTKNAIYIRLRIRGIRIEQLRAAA